MKVSAQLVMRLENQSMQVGPDMAHQGGEMAKQMTVEK